MILKIKDRKIENEQVLSSRNKNCFSLILEKPDNFTFYPGQYLDIKLPVSDPDGDTRAFTISSSPTEDFLMITPKKGLSPFKKFMEELKAGDEIESSHPAGTFTLDETEPAVFIAGGIGIIPFRSIIKYAVDNQLKTSMTLIYSNSDEDYPFKEELERWKDDLSKLTIIYHNSSQNGRLDNTKVPTAVGKTVNTIYYLAGSHSFVNSMEKILLDSGVDQTNIRYDRFDGYD